MIALGGRVGKPVAFGLLSILRPCFSLSRQEVCSGIMSPRNTQTTSSSVDDIVLPEREYGYATKPYEWSDLVDIIEREQNLAKLARSIPQETEYQIYRRNLHQEWKSVYDHILHSKFSFGKRRVGNETNGVWEACPPLSEVKQVQKVLVPNDFPYYNAENIEHWVLWKLCQDITEQEIIQAKLDLREKLGDVVDLLHWINPPHLKSLPDIDHVHILCLRRGQSSSLPN